MIKKEMSCELDRSETCRNSVIVCTFRRKSLELSNHTVDHFCDTLSHPLIHQNRKRNSHLVIISLLNLNLSVFSFRTNMPWACTINDGNGMK